MLGTWVNTLAIIVGSILGLLLRGGIPMQFRTTIMQGLGLAVILIGLTSALKTDDVLIVILSLVIGGVFGEGLKIEDRLDRIGRWLENKLARSGSNLARGFVTASLVYCVGSMAVVGALESGLTGNHQTLFAKSTLDGVASIVFASTLGVGVMLSSVSVLIYQGIITLSASALKQLLIPQAVTQMSAVGGLLIMAIGINLLEMAKLRVGNLLPAIFIPLVYYGLRQFWG
jgi:uncharacterized membrane protein YqgA involved in biofilm formation